MDFSFRRKTVSFAGCGAFGRGGFESGEREVGREKPRATCSVSEGIQRPATDAESDGFACTQHSLWLNTWRTLERMARLVVLSNARQGGGGRS